MPFKPLSILAEEVPDEELAKVVDKFKEIGITPQELNFKIQADRIVHTIEKGLAKINVLAYLPYFLQNDAELIREYLKSPEKYFVLKVLSDWGLTFNISDIEVTENIGQYLRLGTVKDSTMKPTTSSAFPEDFPNPQIYQLVDIIFFNKCFEIEIKTAKYPKLEKNIIEIIRYLEKLMEIVKTKVNTTDEDEKNKEKELRRAYKLNISRSRRIEELKENLKAQRKTLGQELQSTVKVLENYEEKMQTVIQNFRMEIKNCLYDSEKEKMNKCKANEEKQSVIANQSDQIVKIYEDILKDNLAEEKNARTKRLETEAQLLNLISTFDLDIGDKQDQHDKLMAEYNETKSQKERIEKLLEEQEPDYTTSMQEKTDEEERIFNELAYQFYLNRCARSIQRCWRKYVEKRASMKGKKKDHVHRHLLYQWGPKSNSPKDMRRDERASVTLNTQGKKKK